MSSDTQWDARVAPLPIFTNTLSEPPERAKRTTSSTPFGSRSVSSISTATPSASWPTPTHDNPLRDVPPDSRWRITAEIVSVFSDIWNIGEQTPRLLYYLRAALRLLLDTPDSTLLDVRAVLANEQTRARLLRACGDNETRQTWIEFAQKAGKDQAIEVASLQNKAAALSDPLPLRFILGHSTIDFRKLIETGTNLCLDPSGLGDEPAHLLGALVINAFRQAADTLPQPAPTTSS